MQKGKINKIIVIIIKIKNLHANSITKEKLIIIKIFKKIKNKIKFLTIINIFHILKQLRKLNFTDTHIQLK